MPHLRTEIGPAPPMAAPGAAANEGSPARRTSCPLAALAAAASTEHTKRAQDVPSKKSSMTNTSKLNGSGDKVSISHQGIANNSPIVSPRDNENSNKKKAGDQPHQPTYPPPHGYPHQPPPPGYGWGPYPPPPPHMHMKGLPPSSKKKDSASGQVLPTPPLHHYPYYYYHPYPPPPPHMLKGQPPHLPPVEARKVTAEDTMRSREREEEEKKDDSDDGEMRSAFAMRKVKKDTPSPPSKEERRLSKEEYFDDIVKRNLERRKSPGSSEKEEEKGKKKPTASNRIVSPHTSDAPSSNDNSPVPISNKSSHKVPPATAPHAKHAAAPPPPPQPGHYPPYHHYYPYPHPMPPPGSAGPPAAHAYYPHQYGAGPSSSPSQSPPSSSKVKPKKSDPAGYPVLWKAPDRTTAAVTAPATTPAAPKQNVEVRSTSNNEGKSKALKSVEKVIVEKRNNTDSRQRITNLSTHDRCSPLPPPIPSHFYGDIEKEKNVEIPDFHQIINYPEYSIKSRSRSSTPVPGTLSMPKSGLHNCVMCAKKRPATPETIAAAMSDAPNKKTPPPVIPTQNKGLCTACDVVVWVIQATGKNIKWCKGCKNFRNWAAFGEKGSATKCEKCRTRQRAKYLEQRDELKVKRKSLSAGEDGAGEKMKSCKKRRVEKTPGELFLQTAKSEDEALNAAIGLSQLLSSPTQK